MNTFLSSIFLLFVITIFYGTNAQWFIIKKDYPSMSMNYPNPGKRSISQDELNIDCSIPYSYLKSYRDKTAWLLSCINQRSPLTAIDDSSSSSNSNSIEDNLYPSPRLISHERRTPRSTPPYFNEQGDFFNNRLLKRLRRSIKK
jgi:hypothetical protein